MALADDIALLRDRVVSDLDAAHDYYSDAKIAWGIVLRAIAGGHSVLQPESGDRQCDHADRTGG